MRPWTALIAGSKNAFLLTIRPVEGGGATLLSASESIQSLWLLLGVFGVLRGVRYLLFGVEGFIILPNVFIATSAIVEPADLYSELRDVLLTGEDGNEGWGEDEGCRIF
jgi:hypothetical protein